MQKLKLAIDCRPLLDPRPSGVASYTYQMIEALQARPELELQLFYSARKEAPHLKILYPSIQFYPKSSLWTQWKARQGNAKAWVHFNGEKPDLIWIPDRRMPERIEGVPVVMTIHDLIPEACAPSQSWKARLWHRFFDLKHLLKNVNGVLVPSLHVYHQLEAYCQKNHLANPEKEVTYEGAGNGAVMERVEAAIKRPDLEWSTGQNLTAAIKGNAPFFLSISAADPRKRLHWLEAAARRFPKLHFVLVGADEKDPRFAKALRWKTLPKNMQLLPRVSEAQKRSLLKQAQSLIAISQEEGFDLPVLEALEAHCPVILSDISVHRELYESQQWIRSEEDLWLAIERARTSSRATLQKTQIKTKGTFTWKKAAQRASLFFFRVLVNENRQGGSNRNR